MSGVSNGVGIRVLVGRERSGKGRGVLTSDKADGGLWGQGCIGGSWTGIWEREQVSGKQRMRVKRLFGKAPPHRAVFSFPEVRWQFTKPNEVPLNMKETPTAPLFPVRATKEEDPSHLRGGSQLSPLRLEATVGRSSHPHSQVLRGRQSPEHTPTPSLGVHMGHMQSIWMA